ncbi:TRAP transporter small permease [Desulforhopalus singaporensis]|uniref:TRAP-type C4-dicarboxylate transport system, small permease component n=1 Tax=Desulforhopalus singaporensis TaxID=91360 RepID=A0A1H0JXS8_9BACT|nr:TRAP transporter small permease [Desulforhopalus singaporensis]SDO48313.1 TRAP-type C4-dicarboxylate transport system, small permease component [Desulforhopalus singaporensis]
MNMKSLFTRLLDNFESYICRLLLITFVSLLLVQIISREVFDHSSSWIEELSTYLFVWFAYFGPSHAAKMAAHNRVTFQFKLFPKIVQTVCEFIADMIWLSFNLYFVYLSYDFVFHKMNAFWKSQTLGVPMKYFYIVLPVAFVLMSIRVIQVNYLKLVKGIDIRDPDSSELESLFEDMKDSPEPAAAPNTKTTN